MIAVVGLLFIWLYCVAFFAVADFISKGTGDEFTRKGKIAVLLWPVFAPCFVVYALVIFFNGAIKKEN